VIVASGMGTHTAARRGGAGALLLGVALTVACASTGGVPGGSGTGAAPPAPAHQTEEGLASWYGEPYHGRLTSSGAVFDMQDLTAAHRTLPFGTRLKVTRKDTGKSVAVVVNDRGPFVADRILDLSFGAANELDMVEAGVVEVRAEVVKVGDGLPNADCWTVQVGAFKDTGNTRRAQSRLVKLGHRAQDVPAGGGFHRVRVVGLSSRDQALEVIKELATEFPGAVAVPCSGW
jgi:rare lipoprotein A